MAIKYTRSDSTEDAERGRLRTTDSKIRFARFSTAPPSRKALTWIIIGTALIVTLLMISTRLPLLQVRKSTSEYMWQHGTVIANESSEGRRVLRVEIPAEGDEPPRVYDISLDGHRDWAAIAAHDKVRIQVQVDGVGNVERIIRVEPVETPAAAEERSSTESAAE